MVEVITRSGTLRGGEAGASGVYAFTGIPYAQAPVGPNRFAPPRPVEPWSGVRDCTRFGPVAPHPDLGDVFEPIFGSPHPQGDDCLNLNVWTPDPGAAGLPVLVWIHGGGWWFGAGSDPLYDGSAFARDGVVTVTINYRLGVDGFLFLGAEVPGSDNFATLDQIAALQWVQENIAAFGGDPARVTVAGESAGAMSVCTLLATPAARGLFRAAIAQSGAAHHGLSVAHAERIAAVLFDRLGLRWGDVAALAAVPRTRLIEVQMALTVELAATQDVGTWGDLVAKVPTLAYQPVFGTDLLPDPLLDAIRAGARSDVAVLIGHTRDEHMLFLGSMPDAVPIDDGILNASYARVFGADGPAALAQYRAARPEASAVQIFGALETDRQYRLPAIRLAEARSGRTNNTWMYRLSWPSPAFDGRIGAGHATDLPFMFDNLDDSMAIGLVGENAPQALADEMHGAWVRFIAAGDPSGGQQPQWPPYDPGRRGTMEFNAGASRIVDDPDAGERRLWDAVPDRLLGV